jgi:hypothetical protein
LLALAKAEVSLPPKNFLTAIKRHHESSPVRALITPSSLTLPAMSRDFHLGDDISSIGNEELRFAVAGEYFLRLFGMLQEVQSSSATEAESTQRHVF